MPLSGAYAAWKPGQAAKFLLTNKGIGRPLNHQYQMLQSLGGEPSIAMVQVETYQARGSRG